MGGGSGHLIILLIVFGMSAISWVIGKLREQAAIKRMKDELKRRQEEELRTGRTSEPSQPTKLSELQQLRELAIKRQQQLEQMRAAQRTAGQADAARARGTLGAPSQGGPVVLIPSPPIPTGRIPKPTRAPGVPGIPGGPGVPRTIPGGGRPAGGAGSSRPVPRRAAEPEPQRTLARPPATVPVPEPARGVTQGRGRLMEIASAQSDRAGDAGRPSAPAAVELAALVGLRARGGGAAELRRAILLSEVLGPPVSARG